MGARRQIAAAAALALALAACAHTRAASAPAATVEVQAAAIDLDPNDAARRRVGKLLFLSGFELRASDRRFGGISGLWVGERALVAVSDGGYWISAALRHDRDGRLVELSDWQIERLVAPSGRPVARRLQDAEGLARDVTGSFIVSFEGIHRLWRYPPPPAAFRAAPVEIPSPRELARAPANGGIESVAAFPDGRLIVIAENLRQADGALAAWIIDGKEFYPLSYLPSAGFTPSDCAFLKNGDLLVLERELRLLGSWATRIKRVPRASIIPGARLEGEEIARLTLPLAVDNFEGLAVYEHPKAGTLVYLVSDDNYFFLQRTLLLQFRLDEEETSLPRDRSKSPAD
ncbi:MAG TPA: esterase-like activity of phytase family protein [Candidatus Acidoferrales bacterium]|nr:esterase-like activity of phytase family protein [Candidatus Acidoferrales bacterium]